MLAGEVRTAGGPGGGIAVIDVEHRGADCNIAASFQGQENVGFGCRSRTTKTAHRRDDFRGGMFAVVSGIEYNPVDLKMAVELLVNFNEFWSRLREDIARAQDSIWIQTFAFEGDSVGQELAGAMDRQRNGKSLVERDVAHAHAANRQASTV